MPSRLDCDIVSSDYLICTHKYTIDCVNSKCNIEANRIYSVDEVSGFSLSFAV